MGKKKKVEEKVDKSKVPNINKLCKTCPYDCYQYDICKIEYCKWTKELKAKKGGR